MLVRQDCPSAQGILYFFPALNFAHRAFCAAAILLRADADMVRFT